MMLPNLEPAVRVLVLLVYTVTAVGVAWVYRDTPAAVIHLTGAIAGLCAVSLAITYAGLIGLATPDDSEDQGVTFMDRMDREEWDD